MKLKTSSIFVLIFFVFIGCTPKKTTSPNFEIIKHDVLTDGVVEFSVIIKNLSDRVLRVIEPSAGDTQFNIEPVAFCLVRPENKKNQLPEDFKVAHQVYKSSLRFGTDQMPHMTANSDDLIDLGPHEKKTFKTKLHIPEAKLEEKGNLAARCYYKMERLDPKTANSIQVEEFIKKMIPLTLVTKIYAFESK